MTRYGQRTITLKDMVIEHLLGCMENGATIVALRKELGGSTHALTQLLEKMVIAGEAIKLKPDMTGFHRVPGSTAWIVKSSLGLAADALKDKLEDAQEPVVDLSAELAFGDKVTLDAVGVGKAKWEVSRPKETYKLSPRMWIEQVASA